MSENDLPAPAELDEYPPATELDHDIESPEADTVEQHADAESGRQRDDARLPEHIPFDTNEADAAEQSRVVEGGDEDYR